MKSLTPPVELNVLRKGEKVNKTTLRPPRQAVERACVYKGHVKNSPECPAKDKRCNQGHSQKKIGRGPNFATFNVTPFTYNGILPFVNYARRYYKIAVQN